MIWRSRIIQSDPPNLRLRGGVDAQVIIEHAYPRTAVPQVLDLDVGGQYQWRRKGEAHIFSPDVISRLQHATQINSREEFRKYSKLIDEQQRQLLTLRGLLEFRYAEKPVPLAEVEPAAEIVKRFATGAMSQAIIDPAEVRRFAHNLTRFNSELQSQLSLLRGQMVGLSQSWRDQEHEKFAEAFDETMLVLSRFIAASNQQIPLLLRKAERAEEYLRQK